MQGQNQKLLDVLNPEISGVQNYDQTRLKNLGAYLAAFPGSTNSNTFTSNPNTASRVGNAATFLGGIDWNSIFG